MHRDDHDLHAIVDHELDDDGMRTTLGRLAVDPDAAARCAAYTEQRAALTSLREGLGLSLPARSLAELEDELRAIVQRRKQVRLAVAVGGAMAFVGYASRPDSGHNPGPKTAVRASAAPFAAATRPGASHPAPPAAAASAPRRRAWRGRSGRPKCG